MKNFKDWADLLSKWVTIIGAIAAGLFAVAQYLEKAQAERVKASLEYIQQYDGGVLKAAEIRLEDYSNLWRKELLGPMSDQEKYDFLVSSIRLNGLQGDLKVLLEFYEKIQVCTCTKICDGTVFRRFLGRKAYNLRGFAMPYIKEKREELKDPSIGRGLDLLGKNFKEDHYFKDKYCAEEVL